MILTSESGTAGFFLLNLVLVYLGVTLLYVNYSNTGSMNNTNLTWAGMFVFFHRLNILVQSKINWK